MRTEEESTSAHFQRTQAALWCNRSGHDVKGGGGADDDKLNRLNKGRQGYHLNYQLLTDFTLSDSLLLAVKAAVLLLHNDTFHCSLGHQFHAF